MLITKIFFIARTSTQPRALALMGTPAGGELALINDGGLALTDATEGTMDSSYKNSISAKP